jgi:hypothetical protein
MACRGYHSPCRCPDHACHCVRRFLFAPRAAADTVYSHEPAAQHGVAPPPSVYPPAAVYVLCLLTGCPCPGFIELSSGSAKRGIVNHLSHFHDVPACSAADAPVRNCTWFGCACVQRSARCGSRPHGHTAHVKDLADHIMHSHLDLFYACDLCKRAEWATPYALNRHRRRCPGRVAARCTGCLNMFVSQAALEGHVERNECAAATV